jgi:predicted histone-like DNA-binding protein
MPVFYKKYQNARQGDKNYGKWYGHAVTLNTVTTADLASEIAHSTTVTPADVLAVLAELSVSAQRHLLNSERIVLDGLGAFKVGLRTKPADKAEDFGSENVVGYRINYQPEIRFIKTGVTANGHAAGTYQKKLLEGVSVKELALSNAAAGTNGNSDGAPSSNPDA